MTFYLINLINIILLCLHLNTFGQTTEIFSCDSRPQTGLCKAIFIRYYYDKSNNTCNKFIYGGCGRGGGFNTQQICIKTCVKQDTPLDLSKDQRSISKCALKPEIGTCGQILRRFYFDTKTRSCRRINAGCGHFFTINQCLNSCKQKI